MTIVSSALIAHPFALELAELFRVLSMQCKRPYKRQSRQDHRLHSWHIQLLLLQWINERLQMFDNRRPNNEIIVMVGTSKDKGDINLICKSLCAFLSFLHYPRCYIIFTLPVTIFTLRCRSCEKSICESVAELHSQMWSLPICSQRSISLSAW